MNTAAGYKRYDLWCILLCYLGTGLFSLSRHELWGDELHSWNIAKGSLGLADLISNTRYEGHPPLWYLLLYSLSRFTHDPVAIKYLQYVISGLAAFVFLFRSGLQRPQKLLILFGYFFLYEYGVFSRNYALGVLLALLLTVVIKKGVRQHVFLYYGLLLLISNTHFLGCILAASFHLYVMYEMAEKKYGNVSMHAFAGCLLLLPAMYFIYPASGSGLSTGFWLKIWTPEYLFFTADAPLKALCPVPAWWEYHFWNTQMLTEAQKLYPFLKYLNPLFSAGLVGLLVYILLPDKKALLLFISNLLLTLLFALVFPLISTRYTGFIFIGLVMALCLFKGLENLDRRRQILLYSVLAFQVAGACVALKKDWKYPFSHAAEIREIAAKIPEGGQLVTDYWCLNYLSAYLDRPLYCLGFNQERSFLLWDTELTEVARQPDIYTQGMSRYFQAHGGKEVYLITNMPRQEIVKRDSLFFTTFRAQLFAGQYDAIERYSNIYLYRIRPRSSQD